MTNNTREVEEVVKEFYKIFDTDNLWQGEDEWTKNVPIGNIEQWLRTTLHHQLQKAREEERERIIKLIDWRGKGFHSGSEVVAWIDEQLKTLNHSELDQAEPEGGLVDNK